MKLRKLEIKDAPLMLEWMHDKSVVEHLGTNFAAKNIKDCETFIVSSQNDPENLNLCVVDDSDEYMGTVSLKHIDKEFKTAEFATTFRTKAMGKGFSKFGMQSILEIGIRELGLSHIYWCVSPNNERAVRFYDKNGYIRTADVPKHILKEYPEDLNLYWYVYK